VTGGSGGGTQTFLLCAVDPRPAVSVPAVMVSMRMQGGCPCENAAHLRLGTNNVELAALFAPRPMLLIGADDWTLHIEEEGEPELEALYELYGARELVDARCHPEFPHNYNSVSRAHLYSWLGEHLGLEGSQEERAFEPLSPEELSVWTPEHPRPAEAVDLGGLKQAWSESLVAGLLARRSPTQEQHHGPWLDALQVLTHTRLPELGAVALEFDVELERADRAPQPVLLRSEGAQPPLRAWLWRPTNWSGRIVVAASDEGPRALARRGPEAPSLVDRSLDAGVALLACAAPTGEGSPRDGWRHERYPGYTWGYNTTPLARRTDELMMLIAAARELAGEAGEVRLWTSGVYTDARPLASLLSTGVVAYSAGSDFDLQGLAAQLPGWGQVHIQEARWREWLDEVEAEDVVELGLHGT